MRTLADVVASLGPGRENGIIYARPPLSARSPAQVHDPGSVVGAPSDMVALGEADLAHEFLRAWSTWHQQSADAATRAQALLAFMASSRGERAAAGGGPTRVRAIMESGRTYADPTEDLLFQLFLEVEEGEELFLVVGRPSDGGGQAFVQARRHEDGRYRVAERADGQRRTGGTLVKSMPEAYALVCDWTFLGRELRPERDAGVAS